MSNIIDKIQVSGVTYDIQGSGGGVPESAFTAYTATTNERISQDEEVTAAALNVLNESLSGKQDTLSAGTNITISGNVISAEGGGKAIEAGRGISVTTGETADTVSFNLPISAGTGIDSIVEGYSGNTASGKYSHAEGYFTTVSVDYSHAEGQSTVVTGSSAHAEGTGSKAYGKSSHAEGQSTTASSWYSHAEGLKTITSNNSEHASGQYNVSYHNSDTFGDSGNTLFSVGNGADNFTKHNAFEIRQNGDIYLSSGGTDIKLQDHLGGSSITVDTALDSGSTNPVENRVIYNKIDEVEEVTAAGLNALNDKITPTVELTQAQYDALVTAGTVSADTYYIITDATPIDLTNYYTKSETNTLLGGKQATLVSGTNIKTINNESILGSGNIDIQGGSTYTAGRGISIANDVISFSLPISGGTNGQITQGEGNVRTYMYYSHAEGNATYAYGRCSHAEGNSTVSQGNYSHAEGNTTSAMSNHSHSEGQYTIANNVGEHASGKYNVSNTGSTDANKTLFSVGNGTSTSARHNAFEIRQNGDIYLSLNGQDVKLQDQLGGSSITVDTSLDSGSTNPVENRVIYNKIDEVEQVTAAGLNALNDNLGGLKLVKLTQAEYNALATKDSSTLYIIVN